MNVIVLIFALFGGVLGGLSTLYLTISIVAVILWKFYRRITKGISMMK